MKRAINLLAVVLFVACASQSVPIPTNRYGLQVVSDVTTYERLVRQNPDKRLVDLATFIPDVALEMRYATLNNSMHQALYPTAKAFLRYPAALALREVQNELAPQHLGVKIFDAYRPYSVTEKTGDPAQGSRHNRGAAVDLTLIDLRTGHQLPMPSDYDELSDRARRNFTGGPPEALANRQKLEDVMKRHGFEPLPSEWWHFDYSGWRNFELMDVPLEKLGTPER